eukprot:6734657-Karenia_brevis.AAC.1
MPIAKWWNKIWPTRRISGWKKISVHMGCDSDLSETIDNKEDMWETITGVLDDNMLLKSRNTASALGKVGA